MKACAFLRQLWTTTKMSVKTVNEIFGKYEVSKGVNQNDLEILASNPKTQSIQFASPLTDKEIELLELVVFQSDQISL